jgi:DNA-directed RNA polymerase specialized sigma24 family protein
LVGRDRAVAGVDADELVSLALEEYFQSSNGLGWDGTEAGLASLLCRVVKCRFIDHLRKNNKFDRNSESALAAAICDDIGPDEAAVGKQVEDRMLEAVKGHPRESDLRDFILAALMISDGSKVDKQMAELLDVTVDEVRNRRKMILRVTSISQIKSALVRRTA